MISVQRLIIFRIKVVGGILSTPLNPGKNEGIVNILFFFGDYWNFF